jgi:hypothetical protein
MRKHIPIKLTDEETITLRCQWDELNNIFYISPSIGWIVSRSRTTSKEVVIVKGK